MKKNYTFFLFLGLLAGIACSCGGGDNVPPEGPENPDGPLSAPNVSILNLSNTHSCLPDRKISLKARLVKPAKVNYQWSVDGKEVSTDSIYDFTGTREGKYQICLTAGNAAGESADTLSIRVMNGFKFSDIQNWAGEGENQSALVIQWTTGEDLLHPADNEVFALTWGYRWRKNETPTGADLIRNIVKHDPRLYVILTNWLGGVTIRGFGYDGNNDGNIEIQNATLHLTQKDFGENRIYQLKEGEDTDRLISKDPADYWQGGWYVAYASYWLGEGEAVLTPEDYYYSQVFASGRHLENNSWDAWTFSPINAETEENIRPIPRLLKAAPKK